MTDKSDKMPNIIVWTWMSSVLHLSGMELLIFAYIYSVSFDSVHRCHTTLGSMESWFGLTRQAISRRIQSLVDAGFLTKQTSVDTNSGFIKHNSYSVNMLRVTEMCEEADFDAYKNFIDSYGSVLKARFPSEVVSIDNYLETLIQWHETKDVRVCLTMKQISDILLSDDDASELQDIVKIVSAYKKVKPRASSTFVEKKKTAKQNTLFDDPPKKKRNSRSAMKMQWFEKKKAMSLDFVYTNLSGNEEILNAINNFLETDNGMNYNPDQWRQQLNNMYEYGITQDRILAGINTSYMNGYKSLYVHDRNEVDMRRKMKLIDEYTENEELKQLLTSWLFDVPKARSYSENQFKLVLGNLSDICPTDDDKINSVMQSYTNGYGALAYKQKFAEDCSAQEVDMSDKVNAIDKFIQDGYYYLVDGLCEALHVYISKTPNGRSMTIDTFNIVLNNLRLFCLNDSDKVSKVNLAIQNNYKYLATEDFAETKRLKSKLETRESAARSADHFRMSMVLAEMKKNPNNPKLKDVSIKAGEII